MPVSTLRDRVTAIAASTAVLAVSTLAAVGGDLSAAQAAPVWHSTSPAHTAPTKVPGGWRPVTHAEAYKAYVLAFGVNNQCLADFDATWRGTLWLSDLPPAIASDIRWQANEIAKAHLTDEVASTDYRDVDTVIQVRPDEVIVVGPASGLCVTSDDE